LNKSRAYLVKIPKIQKSYSTNIQYANNSKKLDDFHEVNLTKKSVVEVKGPFNDNTFLQYIKKQTKDIVGYNYLEYKEKFNIKGSLDNLRNLHKDIKKMDNNVNIQRKNEQLQSQIKALKNIKYKLQEIEKGVEQEYKNYQNNTKTFFDKCDEIVTLPNPKDMEYLIKIKVMEDYLVYLKKAYEKKIVSFNDMINLTRSFSRQIFNMNYMRSKFKR
jgi:DNA repair ATPase RecN